MSDSKMISEWMRRISEAAQSFESRWTMKALKRVDARLHQLMQEQLDLYHKSLVTGSPEDIEYQGSATIRGYRAIHEAMVKSSEPDDAYMIGEDPRTGMKVAIGDQKSCIDRVRQLHGKSCVWITPDEVATLLGATEGLKMVAAIKNQFPGAEIIDRFPDEPAKNDGAMGEMVA